MRKLVRRLVLPLALVAAFLPARAQSWDAVLALKPGDRVKVEETGGAEHKGRVAAVEPGAISVETGKSQISIERARVRRVQVRSGSVRARNIAIGAAVGLAIGVTVDQTLGAYLRNETGESGRAVTYLAPIGLFGAIGAAIAPYRTVYRVKRPRP